MASIVNLDWSPPDAAAGPQRANDLARLAASVRSLLPRDLKLTDEALLGSLAAIARPTSPAERWRAAFNSDLGRGLAVRGTDLNTVLNIIVGLVPAPRG